MRILVLNYEFPPLGGGAGNASAQIARCLAESGQEVRVLTSWYHGLPRTESVEGYKVHRVLTARRHIDRCSPLEMAAFVINGAAPLFRLAREYKPDILIVFFGIPTGPLGLMVKRLLGVPYILSLRGGDVPGFLPGELGFSHRLLTPITRAVWSQAAAVVANSEGLASLAQRSYRGGRVLVIPNGVDRRTFYPAVDGPSPGDALRLVFVARLVEQKGAELILRALPGARRALQRPVTLDIIGKGPEEPRLKELTRRLGLEGSVCFSGWLERSDVADRLRRSDVFLLPSYEEGMPNVVLEAMACGLPVIASDIYGNRALVEDRLNGLLVPPGDFQAVETAIVALGCQPKERARMSQRALDTAGRHDWAETAAAYLELARNVVRPRMTGVAEEAKAR